VCSLYVEGCGGWALFVGGVGDAGGDAPCASLYARGVEDDALSALCMLEAVEGGLCSLEVF